MLLLSGREANLVGDVAEEIAKATDFLAGGTAAALGDDQLRLYAVEKAVMNAIEASIRLQRENNGRFELLFPGFDFEALRIMGNRLRHDCGNVDVEQLWVDLTGVLPELRKRAEALLNDHRRALGGQGQ